jgi:hypothetical protein
MDTLIRTGRLAFAASMVGFGVLMVIHVSTPGSPALAGPWAAVGPLEGWFVAAALLLLGVGITLRRFVQPPALLLFALLMLVACVHYLPGIIVRPRGGANWTRGFEAVAMGGAALVLGFQSSPTGRLTQPGIRLGQWLFAISLVVFAAQHVIYDELSANIIKPWMPWRMLWVYVAAAGFVATALAILTNRLARLATVLLSVQFLLFVLLIHVPDVIAGANRMRDWTNVFIALSMSSGALIVGRGKLPAAPRVSLIRSNPPSNASS